MTWPRHSYNIGFLFHTFNTKGHNFLTWNPLHHKHWTLAHLQSSLWTKAYSTRLPEGMLLLLEIFNPKPWAGFWLSLLLHKTKGSSTPIQSKLLSYDDCLYETWLLIFILNPEVKWLKNHLINPPTFGKHQISSLSSYGFKYTFLITML